MAKSEYIDLGKTYDPMAIEAKAGKPEKRTEYPTLYLRHDMEGDESKLDSMPDEGEAVIRYQIKSYKEDLKNDTCECEIEIMSIKPLSAKVKKSKTSEDSLDEALTNISKNKK